MSQHVVHLAVRTEDTTMLHERQPSVSCTEGGIPLHNGVTVPNKKRLLSKSVPRHPRSITGVELGAVHLVHAASQIWTHGDVHSQGPCIIMLCSNMAVSNTVQQIVLLRYRGSKITGLLYIATLGYMNEIVRHGKTKMVAASGFKSSRA